MKAVQFILFLSAFSLLATACEPESAASTENEDLNSQGENPGARGRALAIELLDTFDDGCPITVNRCLRETQNCLLEDDADECEALFVDCRDSMISEVCKSSASIDIGLKSTLWCWNKFDRCATSDDDISICAKDLSTCLAAGSQCEAGAEYECDTEHCEVNSCLFYAPGGHGPHIHAGSGSGKQSSIDKGEPGPGEHGPHAKGKKGPYDQGPFFSHQENPSRSRGSSPRLEWNLGY